MIRFRPKSGSERSKEWTCCFCIHVRTATILLGVWHLLLHLVALGFLAAIIREPRLLETMERDMAPMPDYETVPTPQSNVDLGPTSGAYTQPMPTRDHTLIYVDDVDMGALVTVCTLAISLMLVYGAARGKPGHLLPFFCLQLFDFAITVLTATGYLCYLRSIHRLVAETRRVPWRHELLQLPGPVLAFIVLSSFLLAVLIKLYCISIVWRCYKYLTMRAHALQTLTPFVIRGEPIPVTQALAPAPRAPAYPAPAYSSLLPDYDEAVKQAPPPSYHAAMLNATAGPESQPDGESKPAQPTTNCAEANPTTVPNQTVVPNQTAVPNQTTVPATTVVHLPIEEQALARV